MCGGVYHISRLGQSRLSTDPSGMTNPLCFSNIRPRGIPLIGTEYAVEQAAFPSGCNKYRTILGCFQTGFILEM